MSTKKSRNTRPPWQDITNVDPKQYRLSQQQILQKKKLLMSPNNIFQRGKIILQPHFITSLHHFTVLLHFITSLYYFTSSLHFITSLYYFTLSRHFITSLYYFNFNIGNKSSTKKSIPRAKTRTPSSSDAIDMLDHSFHIDYPSDGKPTTSVTAVKTPRLKSQSKKLRSSSLQSKEISSKTCLQGLGDQTMQEMVHQLHQLQSELRYYEQIIGKRSALDPLEVISWDCNEDDLSFFDWDFNRGVLTAVTLVVGLPSEG